MKSYPMTANGYANLEQELANLKQDRRKISADIAEARGHGDLSENAEYHAARRQQGLVEARIRQIETKLSDAEVIDPRKMGVSNKVIFGCWVTIKNLETDEKVEYQIVGEDESDLKENKIAFNSPIAKAMLGKDLKAEIDVVTPGGEKYYEIIKIRYS